MKKTEFVVMVSSGLINSTFKRVYVDENGNRYIKDHGEYKCIENTPCINCLVKD